jgi:SAM-dependent methyltransferase
MTSIRTAYDDVGPDEYYRLHGPVYRNPHETNVAAAITRAVADWSLDLSHVLDLACGSGEATLALRLLGAEQIDGIDPYTADAYLERTGLIAELLTFEMIAAGALFGRRWPLVVCSYAMHLMAESRLPLLARRLADNTDHLLIVSPHKRPALQPAWGWTLQSDFVHERVHCRLYAKQ